MDISPTLATKLAGLGIAYEVVPHHHCTTSLDSAHTARVPARRVVKSVILEDDAGYVMALLPADCHVKIREVNALLKRNMGLAIESELGALFADCELGAIPPVGAEYGLETVVDSQLDDCAEVYIETGNHTDLLHLSGEDFRRLTADYRHASICIH